MKLPKLTHLERELEIINIGITVMKLIAMVKSLHTKTQLC